MLVVGEVLTSFEQQPTGLLQDRGAPLVLHAARFLGANLVERLVHFGADMEAVEDMEGLGIFLADDPEIRLPHVRTDERDLGDDFLAYDGEQPLKGLDSSFLADPEQAGNADVDLINQCQILVTFGVLDFVNADGVDLAQPAVLQPPSDDMLDGIENPFPGSAKGFGRVLPVEAARPTS